MTRAFTAPSTASPAAPPAPPRDRAEAAALLRAARRGGPGADEAAEWAFAAVPDSPAARRLKVQLLLRDRDHGYADALLSLALLRRPMDPGLRLLKARSLFAQERYDEADDQLKLVLVQRPEHGGALELAGRVALQRGDPHQAAAHFRAADVLRPTDRVKALRIAALLRTGRPDLARGVLEQMQSAPLLLRAQVLLAEGRYHEAAETLDRERPPSDDPEFAPVTCALIEVLEETSDARRLAHVLTPLRAEHPAALARAGRAWLALGSFETAILRMAPLARVHGHAAEALLVMMVAASMLNRRRLARRCLERLRGLDEPVERREVADAWSRGLMGRILRNQRSARDAGTDPPRGMLPELLVEAESVLDGVRGGGAPLPPPRRLVLERHIETCRKLLGALGARAEAAAVGRRPFAGSRRPGPPGPAP